MTKLKDNFGQWVDLAKTRANIRLMDGREATLLAVRKPSRNCKIRLGNRHYLVWIDDIALVQWPGTDKWCVLDAWPVVDLDTRPGVQIAPGNVADTSSNWLKVVPNPQALHPSFQPPQPVVNRPAFSGRPTKQAWLVPSTPPPTT